MAIDTLLSEFAGKRQDHHTFERLVALVTTSPAEAEAFAKAAMTALPKGGTFLDLTLSFVEQAAFDELITMALADLGTDAAASVIAHASLQFPELLHPHLPRLFELQPNGRTYYAHWPWRDSGGLAESDLLHRLDSDASDDERLCAWLCLLETRHLTSVRHALDRASRMRLSHPVELYLHEVGLESAGSFLFQPSAQHIVFDTTDFVAPRPAWSDRSFHPTWSLGGTHTKCRFGGHVSVECGLCGGQLHHLVTLPGQISASSTPLLLATCLSCLGWEQPTLSYCHDETGNPLSLDKGQVTPEFPAGPLRELVVRLTQMPERWRWQDWALSNGRENLNRVHGYPSWIQSAEYPKCQRCGNTMPFLIQLDSDLPTEDGNEWLWGSGGICYGFFCRACRISTFLWQCT